MTREQNGCVLDGHAFAGAQQQWQCYHACGTGAALSLADCRQCASHTQAPGLHGSLQRRGRVRIGQQQPVVCYRHARLLQHSIHTVLCLSCPGSSGAGQREARQVVAFACLQVQDSSPDLLLVDHAAAAVDSQSIAAQPALCFVYVRGGGEASSTGEEAAKPATDCRHR